MILHSSSVSLLLYELRPQNYQPLEEGGLDQLGGGAPVSSIICSILRVVSMSKVIIQSLLSLRYSRQVFWLMDKQFITSSSSSSISYIVHRVLDQLVRMWSSMLMLLFMMHYIRSSSHWDSGRSMALHLRSLINNYLFCSSFFSSFLSSVSMPFSAFSFSFLFMNSSISQKFSFICPNLSDILCSIFFINCLLAFFQFSY